MELIDRKALANEDPCEHCHYKRAGCVYTCGEKGYAEHAIWRTIDDAPAVDAVEVVRCENCLYWNKENEMCNAFDAVTPDDGYCYFGMLREVE